MNTCTDTLHTAHRHHWGMCEDYSATLPDYVQVDCQGFWANVLVPANDSTLMVLMVLPPRVWLRERPRAIAMIRAELRACGIAA